MCIGNRLFITHGIRVVLYEYVSSAGVFHLVFLEFIDGNRFLISHCFFFNLLNCVSFKALVIFFECDKKEYEHNSIFDSSQKDNCLFPTSLPPFVKLKNFHWTLVKMMWSFKNQVSNPSVLYYDLVSAPAVGCVYKELNLILLSLSAVFRNPFCAPVLMS